MEEEVMAFGDSGSFNYPKKYDHWLSTLYNLTSSGGLGSNGIGRDACPPGRQTQTSPLVFLTRLRLQYACVKLEATDIPIAEVAALAGFDDAFYFSRVFTRHYGMAPTAYRMTYSPQTEPASQSTGRSNIKAGVKRKVSSKR